MFLESNVSNCLIPDEDKAVLTRSFWNDDGSDRKYGHFCKPIKTPSQNGLFGMNRYNCHPLQHLNR